MADGDLISIGNVKFAREQVDRTITINVQNPKFICHIS
jgi:hypothetical protein